MSRPKVLAGVLFNVLLACLVAFGLVGYRINQNLYLQKYTLDTVSQKIEASDPNLTIDENSSLIYGTFADFRDEASPVLRFLLFRQCRLNKYFDVKMKIFFPNSTNRVFEPELVDLHGKTCPWNWAPDCKWDSHFMKIQLPQESFDEIQQIELFGPRNSAPVKNIEKIPIPRAKSHDLAVCVLPLYLYGDWPQMVTFFEIWRKIGAEKFLIYTTSITESVDRILKVYEELGIVERYIWPTLPKTNKYDPNDSIYRFGHTLAMNDCVLRTAGWAKFVALVDFDEFIFPTLETENLVALLEKKLEQHPKASSFSLTHRKLFYPQSYEIPERMSVRDLDFTWLNDAVLQENSGGPPKTIFVPERTEVLNNHYVFVSKTGFWPVGISTNEAVLLHLRKNNQIEDETGDFRKFNRFTEEFTREIQKGFDTSFQQFFGEQEILDTGPNVVDVCMSEGHWRKHGGCKIPHKDCRKFLESNVSSWIIYDDSQRYLVAQ